jgi:hypothetical protein
VAVEAPGELVVVVGSGGAATVDVEVDAIERRVAEGAGNAGTGAAEVGVPEVVGELRGGLRGRE